MRPHKYESNITIDIPYWCDFTVCLYHTAWVSDFACSTSMDNVRDSICRTSNGRLSRLSVYLNTTPERHVVRNVW